MLSLKNLASQYAWILNNNMTVPFTHLHVHSEYSISDSLVRIPSLVKRAVELNMPAVVMTDQMNLFGAVKFYKAALSAGIKPIIGADIYLENLKDRKSPFQLVLLCQNDDGYKSLIQLLSRAYVENQQQGRPVVQRSWLKQYSDRLIALSGIQSDIGQSLLRGNPDIALEYLKECLLLIPDRYYF